MLSIAGNSWALQGIVGHGRELQDIAGHCKETIYIYANALVSKESVKETSKNSKQILLNLEEII